MCCLGRPIRSLFIVLLIAVPSMTRASQAEKEVDRELRERAREKPKKKCSVACSTVMRNLLSALSDFSSLSAAVVVFLFAEIGLRSLLLGGFRAVCYVTLSSKEMKQ